MHKEQLNGNLRTPESKRKAKNRKRRPMSAHTKRIRADKAAPVAMRSMAPVGGPTRRAMKKRERMDVSRLSAVAMLPQWMQAGLAAFAKIAQAVQAKHEASKKPREQF